MKRWQHASASQIRTYRRCARKWYFDKIVGLGATIPTSKGAEFGGFVHTEMEHLLLTGKGQSDNERVQKAAQALLRTLPVQRALKSEVEYKIEIRHETLPVKIIGFVDLGLPHTRELIDHKTLKSFRYRQTAKTLANDVQAIIYGTHALLNWGSDEGGTPAPVRFTHHYVNTVDFSTSQTSVVIDAATAMNGFEAIAKTVREMHADSGAVDAGGVAFNDKACRDFGGCPFANHCNAVGDRRTPGMLTALYRAAIKTPEKVEKSKMGWRDNLKGNKLGKTATDAATASVEVENKLGKNEIGPLADAGQINPPDGAADGETVEQPDGGTPTYNGKKLDKYSVGEIRALHAQLLGGLADAADYTAKSNLPKKPHKADYISDLALLMRLGVTAAPAAPAPSKGTQMEDRALPPEPAAEKSTVVELPPVDGCTLYISCMPRGETVTHLENFIAQIQDKVAEAEGVIYYSAIPYSAGPGKVAAVLAKNLREGMVLPRHLVANPRLPCTDKCLEVLIPLALRVVERI